MLFWNPDRNDVIYFPFFLRLPKCVFSWPPIDSTQLFMKRPNGHKAQFAHGLLILSPSPSYFFFHSSAASETRQGIKGYHLPVGGKLFHSRKRPRGFLFKGSSSRKGEDNKVNNYTRAGNKGHRFLKKRSSVVVGVT